MSIEIRSSAVILPGVKTNRVRVRRRPMRLTADVAYRQDRNRPSGYKVISISVAPDELERIDEIARALQLSRSRLLALAALSMETEDDGVAAARERLEKASLVIGDMLANDLDPGWDEQQELEAAAIAYRAAVRGAK